VSAAECLHAIEIEWIAELASFLPGRARLDQIGGLPALILGEFPLLGWNGFLKRVMDVALSASGLLALAPFFATIGLAVKLSSRGPIFYRQLRVGRDGRRFQMIKFRTMRLDAETGSGPVAAAREDPRVTPIGRWLRRTSLDELPQLANVLKGEMSLVGPRPERPQFIGNLTSEIPDYLGRLRVKSGMTGWAQIHGLRGGESSMAERVRCDLYYIEHWSVGLDLRILLQTVFSPTGSRMPISWPKRRPLELEHEAAADEIVVGSRDWLYQQVGDRGHHPLSPGRTHVDLGVVIGAPDGDDDRSVGR
jgi:exopolysaccharide biosynthesis polyprenyl glycosylphosphotransferase